MRGRHSDRAKHRIVYDGRWEAAYKWFFYVEGEGMYMYCKFCCNFKTKNHQNQSKVWNKEACTTICKDVPAKHEGSIMHREALEHEHACHVVKVQGGIKEAMQRQGVLQSDAVIGAMKCLYWLCKQGLSHNFFFTSM